MRPGSKKSSVSLLISFLLVPTLSYSNFLTNVFFSRSGDTVITIEQRFDKYEHDTSFYFVTVLDRPASAYNLDTINFWEVARSSRSLLPESALLNPDSARKYHIVEDGIFIYPDSCGVFTVRYKNTSSELTSGPKKDFYKDRYKYWYAEYDLHTDIEFYADSTLIHSEKNATLRCKDRRDHKRDLGELSSLKDNATQLRIFRSPTSGTYFVEFMYLVPQQVAYSPFRPESFHYIVPH